jgi:hypothetical protein
MKKIIFPFIFLFYCFGYSSVAQENSDNDLPEMDNRTAVNFFGGLLAEPCLFNQEVGLSMGATMGLTYKDHFYLGGYYDALVSGHFRTDIEVDSVTSGTRLRGSLNHGGILMGYVWKPQNLMNLNFSLRLGWGSVWYYDPAISNSDRLDELYGKKRDKIFVITPGVEYTITPITWMRIGIGMGYRVVLGLDQYTNADYDSPVGIISLSFGSFKNKPMEEPETDTYPQP